MIESKVSNNAEAFIHEGLNVVGDVSERPIKLIFAATASIAALDIIKNKSSLHSLIKLGAIMAVALKGISMLADLGVDRISRTKGSA